MSFIRVKSANPDDPQHEFDAPSALVGAHPERYVVVDFEPVDEARPVEYVVPIVPPAPDVFAQVVKRSRKK